MDSDLESFDLSFIDVENGSLDALVSVVVLRELRCMDLSHWFSTRQVCAQEGKCCFPTWRSRVLKTALRLRPRRALSSASGQSSKLA